MKPLALKLTLDLEGDSISTVGVVIPSASTSTTCTGPPRVAMPRPCRLRVEDRLAGVTWVTTTGPDAKVVIISAERDNLAESGTIKARPLSSPSPSILN